MWKGEARGQMKQEDRKRGRYSEGGMKRLRQQKERQGLVGVAILAEDTEPDLHCPELLESTGSCSGWQLGKQEL